MAGSRSDRWRVLLLAGASVAVVTLGLLLLPGDPKGPGLPERVPEPVPVPAVPALLPVGAADETAPEKAAAEAEHPEGVIDPGTWVVTVLGPGDLPQEEVVLVPWGSRGVTTDAQGRARFPPPAPGEEKRILVMYPYGGGEHTIPRDASVIRLPEARPLEVEFLDGSSGKRLTGIVESVWKDDLAIWFFDSAKARSGRLATGPILAGSSVPLRLGFHPPRGFDIPANRERRFQVHGSRLADRYRLRVPLWPELEIKIHVRERDGTPGGGAFVTHARVGEALIAETLGVFRGPLAESAKANEDGLVMLRGLPTVPGETVRVTVRSGNRIASGSAVIRGFREPVEIEVTLPPPGTAGAAASSVIGIGGGAGGSFGGRGGSRGPPPQASLVVRVLRRGGQPVADAKVFLKAHRRSGRTNGEGVARFDGLRPVEEWVSVREPGYVSGPPVEVSLQNGAEVGVTIKESAGRSSFVQVLNEDGDPVCCAALTVVTENGVPYTPVVSGVQDLVLLTDRDGRAALPDLPPGKMTVTATFGTRRAMGEADAGGSLVLVLER